MMEFNTEIIALHEVGHAVQFLLEGANIESITIIPNNDTLGGVTPTKETTKNLKPHAHVRIALAGATIEIAHRGLKLPSNYNCLYELMQKDENIGWIKDFERAEHYSFKAAGCPHPEVDPGPELSFYEPKENLLYQEFKKIYRFYNLAIKLECINNFVEHLNKYKKIDFSDTSIEKIIDISIIKNLWEKHEGT